MQVHNVVVMFSDSKMKIARTSELSSKQRFIARTKETNIFVSDKNLLNVLRIKVSI